MLSSLSSFWPQTSSHRPRLLAAPQAPRVPLRVTQASLLSSLPCSTRGTSAWAAGKSCVWGLPPTRSRRARANPEWPLRAPVTAQARVPRSKHLGADVAEQSLGRAARGSAAVDGPGGAWLDLPPPSRPGRAPARPPALELWPQGLTGGYVYPKHPTYTVPTSGEVSHPGAHRGV